MSTNSLRRIILLIGVVAGCVGCSTVSGSAIGTSGASLAPNSGPVQLLTLSTPPGAAEVGIIQARGRAHVDELAPEFVAQAARLGAEIAKVDAVTTKFEMVHMTESYSYKCGQSNCTGTRSVMREVATTQMVGRAFRRRSP